MVLPHPVHKRILSRIAFYSAVACYLWIVQLMEHRDAQPSQSARATASLFQ